MQNDTIGYTLCRHTDPEAVNLASIPSRPYLAQLLHGFKSAERLQLVTCSAPICLRCRDEVCEISPALWAGDGLLPCSQSADGHRGALRSRGVLFLQRAKVSLLKYMLCRLKCEYQVSQAACAADDSSGLTPAKFTKSMLVQCQHMHL